MDHHLPQQRVTDRIRARRVSQRLAATRLGRTTRNHHRVQELQQVAFIALLAIGVVGTVLLVGT
jgi:hypothetical protein